MNVVTLVTLVTLVTFTKGRYDVFLREIFKYFQNDVKLYAFGSMRLMINASGTVKKKSRMIHANPDHCLDTGKIFSVGWCVSILYNRPRKDGRNISQSLFLVRD